MRKYLDIKGFQKDKSEKEIWKNAKKEGYDALRASVKTIFTKAENNRFHFVFSTSKEDRHGEIVRQDWDLKYFKKNPVLLDSHRYESIEFIIGRVKNVKVVDGKLQGDVDIALENPKGKLAYDMIESGFISTTSVGFIPQEFGEKGEIIKSELLEVSLVSVPANPEALIERKQKNECPKINPTDKKSNEKTIAGDVGSKQSKLAQLAEAVKQEETLRRLFYSRIAGELEKYAPLNLQERKRKLYRDLRKALSKDI